MTILKNRITQINPVDRLAAPGEACMVQVFGQEVGRCYPISDAGLVVGRDPDCGVVVPLNSVSRQHCRLSKRGEKLYLADLGSTNGTLLNNEPVRGETLLRSGDLMKVGEALFEFRGLGGGDVMLGEDPSLEAEANRITDVKSLKNLSGPGGTYLVEIFGPDPGKYFPIGGVQLIVGRDPSCCDVVVRLENVSRQHCKFYSRGNEVFLTDLGSANGTYLNNAAIGGEVILRSGDMVGVGEAVFKLHSGTSK